jgi:hypothetical protein
MAKIVREIPITRLDAQNDPKFAYQQSVRDEDKQILAALNLKMNNEAVKTTDVFTNLAPQTFKMAGVTADDARVSSTGASISTTFAISGTRIIISNVDFVSTIAIGATSTVIFLGMPLQSCNCSCIWREGSFQWLCFSGLMAMLIISGHQETAD